MANICVVGAFDTKADFFYFLAKSLKQSKCCVTCVNFGGRILKGQKFAEFSNFHSVLSDHEKQQIPQGEADQTSTVVKLITGKIGPFFQALTSGVRFDAIIGGGGSNGTNIFIEGVLGVDDKCHKICISTISAEVHAEGIDVIPSFTDIIGLNPILTGVANYVVNLVTVPSGNPVHRSLFCGKISRFDWLQNATQFIHENCDVEQMRRSANQVVGITMFGVTTPCVEKCAEILDQFGYQVMIFHAVGAQGGELMARLIQLGLIQGGVIDLTTSEIADTMCGGICYCSYGRFYVAGSMGIPQIISSGGLDIINYLKGNLPSDRKQNPMMAWNIFDCSRTTENDNIEMGRFLADVANRAPGRTKIIIPKYFSKVAAPGNIFYSPKSDEAFTTALEAAVSPEVVLIKYDGHINDPEFAELLVREFLDLKSLMTAVTLQNSTKSLCLFRKKYQILKSLRQKIQAGKPIIIAGSEASLEDMKIADMIIIQNLDHHCTDMNTSAGLNTTKEKELIAELCACNETIPMMELLEKVIEKGIIGVQNSPAPNETWVSGVFSKSPKRLGMVNDKETEMVRLANQLGLLTVAYVFNQSHAETMAKHGADIMVIYLGSTNSSIKEAEDELTLEDASKFTEGVVDTIRKFSYTAIILVCGIVTSTESFQYVAERNNHLSGFVKPINCMQVTT